MSNETDDEERLRVLNEMRAYGKATPFAHVASPSMQRPNVFDQATAEWLRSKTFRTMITLGVGIPLAVICVTLVATTCVVLLGGYAVLAQLRTIFGILGLGGQ